MHLKYWGTQETTDTAAPVHWLTPQILKSLAGPWVFLMMPGA